MSKTLGLNTADVKPVVAIIVFCIEVGTIVFQVPPISSAIRVARPPVPIPGIVESTTVVVAASDWAKGLEALLRPGVASRNP